MATEEWFRLEDGQQVGPLSREQLASSLLQRSGGVLVWRQGMPGWARPEDVPDLVHSHVRPLPRVPPPYEAVFRELAQAYGAEAQAAGEDALLFEIARDGVVTQVRGDIRETRVRLSLTRPGAWPEISAFRAGALERMGQRLRLGRRVRTGDAEFDTTMHLDTALSDTAVRQIAGRAEFRRGVRNLMAQGFQSVHAGEEGLSIERSVTLVEELDRSYLDAALAALGDVESALRDADPAWAGHRTSSWPFWIMAAAASLGLAGVPALFAAGSIWEPAHVGYGALALAAGGALWALALPLLVLLLRRRSDAMFHLAVTGFLLLVGIPCSTAAGLIAYNGLFDQAPAVERSMVVIDKSYESRRRMVRLSRLRSRYERYHTLTLAAGSDVRKIRVSDETYASVERGTRVMVAARPGALGWEWDPHVP